MNHCNKLISFQQSNIRSREFDKIIFVVTRSCQLSCSYCYVKREDAHMTYDVLYRSLWVISQMKKKKPVTIIFFGGEPLLKFNLIKLAILTLNKIDKKNIHNYDFSLFTNGVLLNHIDLVFLKKFKVRLDISLDGERKTHNINRGSKNIDSYGAIIKAMPKIKSLGINTTVFSTLTVDTARNLYRNYLYFKNLGFNSIETCPVLYTADIKHKLWD